MKQTITIVVWIICSTFIHAQGVLRIQNNTFFNTSGNIFIKINNVDFIVQGSFNPPGSTLEISGNDSSNPSIIIGSNPVTFNNLTINRTNNNIKLEQTTSINGDLTFNSGNLDLNGFDLTLNSGASIIGEVENRGIITSSFGTVIYSTTLNSPNNENPGNLGAEITSSSNLGLTTITRGHTVQSNGNGNSIKRYYDINPTNNTGLNATLRFHYLDSELNGIPEEELELFRFDGSNWSSEGFTTRNSNDNYIELEGINAFSRWTATNQANSLPVELVYFSAQMDGQIVKLKWETRHEIDFDYFQVERSDNGLDFQVLSTVNSEGNFDDINKYETMDSNPNNGFNYYRLKLVDLDGTFEYSEIVTVNRDSKNPISIYPNPTTDKLIINGIEAGDTHISIIDSYGNLVFEDWLDSSQELDLENLPAGLYFILLNKESLLFKSKFTKL